PSSGRPYWSEVLRTLREAGGITQGAWAALLGYSSATVRRWESGSLAPSAEAEAALIAGCTARGLFRRYDRGVLAGVTLSADTLRELLALARLGPAPDESGQPSTPSAPEPSRPDSPPMARTNLPAPLTSFVGRTEEVTDL